MRDRPTGPPPNRRRSRSTLPRLPLRPRRGAGGRVNRIGPALYIPLAGWAILAAVVVAGIVNRISAWAAPPVRIPVAVGLVLLAVIPFAREGRASVQDRYKPAMADDGKLTATVIAQLNLIRPQVRPGARWLFLNDPFDYYDMVFIAQLWAHRRDMDIRLARMDPVPPEEQGQYDSIFGFDNEKLIQLK